MSDGSTDDVLTDEQRAEALDALDAWGLDIDLVSKEWTDDDIWHYITEETGYHWDDEKGWVDRDGYNLWDTRPDTDEDEIG